MILRHFSWFVSHHSGDLRNFSSPFKWDLVCHQFISHSEIQSIFIQLQDVLNCSDILKLFFLKASESNSTFI